jgi:hypothetical protein
MDLLRRISAKEFETWTPAMKVIVHDHPRRFASLTLRGGKEDGALCWRSDLVEPVVLIDESALIWIGVDQHVVCITHTGTILFSIGLGSSLLDIKRFPDVVAILCDAEVLLINLDYSIRRVCALGDVPSTIQLVNDKLVVTFVDGGTEMLA